MARASKVIVVVAAFVAVCHLRSYAFVAPPSRKALAVAPAAGFMACLTSAAPAFADVIDDAAEKLAAGSYAFLKEVPWTSSTYATIPGDPLRVLKVIDKCLIMGAAMDSSALKGGVLAHSKAISSIDANGVTSQQDYAAILKGIGHMINSVGEKQVMDVYDAGKELVPGGVAEYLMSTVKPEDAQAAYRAFIEFTTVVKTAGRGM